MARVSPLPFRGLPTWTGCKPTGRDTMQHPDGGGGGVSLGQAHQNRAKCFRGRSAGRVEQVTGHRCCPVGSVKSLQCALSCASHAGVATVVFFVVFFPLPSIPLTPFSPHPPGCCFLSQFSNSSLLLLQLEFVWLRPLALERRGCFPSLCRFFPQFRNAQLTRKSSLCMDSSLR